MNNRYVDGWDLVFWIGESRDLAEEIFDAVSDFIAERFDPHDLDDECILSWVATMNPAEFEDEAALDEASK